MVSTRFPSAVFEWIEVAILKLRPILRIEIFRLFALETGSWFYVVDSQLD